MSTRRYLILTTLWAAVLPGLVVSTPFLLLGCITPAIIVAGPLLALVIFLFYRFNRFIRAFDKTAREGRIPTLFPVRILPFFLPLYYVLILTAIGFYRIPGNKDAVQELFIWRLPQYFPWNIFNSLSRIFGGSAGTESGVLVPLIASALTAVVGSIYIFRVAPPSRFRATGMILMLAVTVALGWTALHWQQRFRENLLTRDHDAVVVQDEKGRQHWGGDETDLSEYQPFKPDNKLVKIEVSTLTIESKQPRIHGALALYPVYAAAVEAIYRNVEAKQFGDRYGQDNLIQGGTTPAAFESLLEGKVDMVFMAKPSLEQMKEAEHRGKTLSITPIGSESFVFFVSKVNPVENLTVEQIRDIYSKRITRWNELGGKNEKILPFQRPEGSGSQTAMERIMGDVQLAKPVQEEFQISMGGIVNRVADYRNYGNSIGYSFRYYVEGMLKHDGVKLLSVNGIDPTIENIRNDIYPFTGPMVIITAGSENPNVPKLIDWFLSPQGQDLLERVGYVPLVPTDVTIIDSTK